MFLNYYETMVIQSSYSRIYKSKLSKIEPKQVQYNSNFPEI